MLNNYLNRLSKHLALPLFFLAAVWSGNANASVDLVVENASAPVSASAGDTISINYSLSNRGSTLSYVGLVQVYLSTSPTVDNTQHFQDYSGLMLGFITNLNPGETRQYARTVTLPDNVATGTYYIGVYVYTGEPESNTTNNFSYQTIHVTGTSCTDDNYENDNSTRDAKILSFAQPQVRNHCNGTSDWVLFSAEAGKTYAISADELGNEAWVGLSLFDSSGSTLLATSTSPKWNFNAARIVWTAPTTGNYVMKVTPVHGLSNSGANTGYTLTLGDLLPDLVSESNSSQINTVPGSYIYFNENIRNHGFTAAGPFKVGIYLSTDESFSSEDVLIGSRTVQGLGVGDISYSDYLTDNYNIPAATMPGTYYILSVADHNNAINEYIRSNNVSAPVMVNVGAWDNCTPDAYEEDDRQSDANDIVVSFNGQQHNFCEDRADWLRFNANAGTTYIINSYNIQTKKTLYGPDGTTRLVQSDSKIRWTAPTTDTYYLNLYSNYSFGQGSDYVVKVEEDLADLSVFLSVPNPTINAGGLLGAWDSVSNTGYKDSGPFTVSVYLSTDETITRADTLLYKHIIDNFSPFAYQDNSSSYILPISKDLPTGVYYVGAIIDSEDQVSELREDNNQSEVHVIYVTTNSCVLDDYEDDDTLAQAKPILAEEVQQRTTCDDGLDWVEFNANADTTYLIEGDGDFTANNVSVYAADGKTWQQTEAEYFYDTFSWRPTVAGKYYIKVTNQHPGSLYNAYTLNVHACDIDAYEQDDIKDNATLLTPGELQEHNYCDDNSDWYRFEAVAGMEYYFEGVNVGGKSNVLMYLQDADGTRLASSPWPSPKGNKPATITWVAPAGGTYYVSTGDYHNWGKQREYTIMMTESAPKGRNK